MRSGESEGGKRASAHGVKPLLEGRRERGRRSLSLSLDSTTLYCSDGRCDSLSMDGSHDNPFVLDDDTAEQMTLLQQV